jgi:predicted extracellular nuclease
MVGTAVQVEGIVAADFQSTATQLGGFYLQEPDDTWDADPATSEGIFVFDSNFGVNVTIGDRVRVLGTVTEFVSSGTSLTEIGTVQAVQVCSTGNTFQRTTVSLPVAAISDWERYEGMAVRFTQPLTVTGNFDLGGFGSVELAPSRLMQPTQIALPGAPALAQQALNDRSVIVLDDASTLANANLFPTLFPAGGLSASNTLRAGSRTVGPVDGILDQRFGAYRLQLTGPITFDTSNARPAVPPAVGGRIRVASANLLNFFTTLGAGNACGPTGTVSCRGANNAAEYSRQIAKTVAAIVGMNPDLLGVIELENNPSASITALVDALNLATAPGTYTYINTGTTGTDSIRNAIVYKPAVVTPVGVYKILDATVDARVLFGNRPSLAQTFQPAAGDKTDLQRFTFVVNHFRSKGSSCAADGDPNPGDLQGECNLNRVSIAQALIDWLGTNPTADPTAAADRKILLVGDFNAYLKEDPIRALMDTTFSKGAFPANPRAVYRNLVERIAGPNAYSYVFSHQSGYLDHALANPAMDLAVKGLVEWHNNADEPDVLDYNLEAKSAAAQTAYYAPDAFRASDHDPILIGINPLVGDFDDNGTIDATDQALLRANFGKPAASVDRRMDFDGDGKISLSDYRVWYHFYLAYTR